MKKFIVSVLALFSVVFILAGCGAKKSADYTSAEKLETALNDGKNVDGKTVTFKVTDTDSKGPLGYMIYGGKHLNFVNSKAPKVSLKAGDTVTIKIDETSSVLGSWLIKYTEISK